MTDEADPDVKMWLAGPLPADVEGTLARLVKAQGVRHIRIMPDVHLAREVCVGVVVATERFIYPSAVGADIGCGMAAVALDCGAEVLASREAAGRLLAALYRDVPANRHAKPRPLPPALADRPLGDGRLEMMKRRDAAVQFGTLGRGNHFLEIQADEAGQLWLMVHSGSRAIGQAIHEHYLARAVRTAGGLCGLDSDSDSGHAYLADVGWAVDYAAASRRAMIEAAGTAAEASMGARAMAETYIDCGHNHVRAESHPSRRLWVHRKGAISAQPGEIGIIPGAMGRVSFHVEGRGEPDSLCSSSHGAGRVMSRTDARRKITTRELQQELEGIWYDHRLAAALRDEAPAAYRDVEAVMRAQRDLTRIVRRLRPVLCYKGA